MLGGYQLDDVAVITYEGRDGAEWIVRGYKLMERRDNRWSSFGGGEVSIPPG